MQTLKGSALADVKYAVFGCGNRDWVRTFQRVPRVVDELLGARGGTRLLERGVGDAQAADFFEAFDEWEGRLWETLAKVSTRGRRSEGTDADGMLDRNMASS